MGGHVADSRCVMCALFESSCTCAVCFQRARTPLRPVPLQTACSPSLWAQTELVQHDWSGLLVGPVQDACLFDNPFVPHILRRSLKGESRSLSNCSCSGSRRRCHAVAWEGTSCAEPGRLVEGRRTHL